MTDKQLKFIKLISTPNKTFLKSLRPPGGGGGGVVVLVLWEGSTMWCYFIKKEHQLTTLKLFRETQPSFGSKSINCALRYTSSSSVNAFESACSRSENQQNEDY